jgi:hypothetical protein
MYVVQLLEIEDWYVRGPEALGGESALEGSLVGQAQVDIQLEEVAPTHCVEQRGVPLVLLQVSHCGNRLGGWNFEEVTGESQFGVPRVLNVIEAELWAV